MAVVTSIGTNTGASGATLAVAVPAAGVPAGQLIVVVVTEKSTSGVSGSVADTAGNAYSAGPAANLAATAADGRGMLFYAWNSKALVSGNSITYTRNLSAASCAISACWSDGILAGADPHDSATNATGTGTTGTITATSGTPAVAGELFIGALCASGSSTTGGNATFTQAASWSLPPNQATTGGSAGSRSAGGNRVNTGVGTLVYNPTLSSTAQQWAVLITGFKTVAPFGWIGGAGNNEVAPKTKRTTTTRDMMSLDDPAHDPQNIVVAPLFYSAVSSSAPLVLRERSVYYPTAWSPLPAAAPTTPFGGATNVSDYVLGRRRPMRLNDDGWAPQIFRTAVGAVLLPSDLAFRRAGIRRLDDLAAPLGVAQGEFLPDFIQWQPQFDNVRLRGPRLLDQNITVIQPAAGEFLASYVSQWLNGDLSRMPARKGQLDEVALPFFRLLQSVAADLTPNDVQLVLARLRRLSEIEPIFFRPAAATPSVFWLEEPQPVLRRVLRAGSEMVYPLFVPTPAAAAVVLDWLTNELGPLPPKLRALGASGVEAPFLIVPVPPTSVVAVNKFMQVHMGAMGFIPIGEAT